jgi:hypothetical protein
MVGSSVICVGETGLFPFLFFAPPGPRNGIVR